VHVGNIEEMLVTFVALLVAEVFAIVEVAHALGVLNTLVLLVLVSLVGVWLMRRVGLGVWRRARSRVQAGEVPGREITDGVLVLSAGALLAVPGFITDVLGLLLLLPPVRAVVRAAALRRLGRRASLVVVEGRAREVSRREIEP
jgi:UPF0716 protein FxsA